MKRYRDCVRVLLALLLAISSLCVFEACFKRENERRGAIFGEAEAAAPLAPSNEALRERIALLEQALRLRRTGERMEAQGDLIGALLSFRRSDSLFPDPLLAERMRRLEAGEGTERPPRPDLQPLRERIALMEELLAGLDMLGELLASPEKEAAPSPPELPELPGERSSRMLESSCRPLFYGRGTIGPLVGDGVRGLLFRRGWDA